MANYIPIWVYTKHVIKMIDIDLQIRVNNLNLNSLRAALFSIEDTQVLNTAVDAGEHYQKLTEKIGRKEKSK